MTKEEARRRAVEAAAKAICTDVERSGGPPWEMYPEHERSGRVAKETFRNQATDAIAAYERAMADAGWRMVRVPKKKDPTTTLYVSNDALAQERDASYVRRRMVADVNWAAGKVEGWNACRAAMLGEGGG